MLKKLLLVAAAIGLTCAAASSKVIKSPAYDFRKNGILKVSAVEQTKDATRVTFKAKYKPKWWIRVDTSEVFIHLPETGEVVKPLSYDCDFKFNDKFVMPESGEHEFTLTYPPLPKGVKKIDTGSSWGGMALTSPARKRNPPRPSNIPLIIPSRRFSPLTPSPSAAALTVMTRAAESTSWSSTSRTLPWGNTSPSPSR